VPARRIERKTSRTAEMTCMSRAASSLEPDPHYRSDDTIALLLVPSLLKVLLHVPWMRRFFRRTLAPYGMYEYTIARTKYIDGVFKEDLAAGFDQILIFGAGFDTRALRFEGEARNTRIFELDAPLTQQAKLGQYKKRGLTIPANVQFIPIDFDRESPSEKLDQAGFASGARSLFVLEGLLMYLQPESVDATFTLIQSFAGHGSEVVFDYVRASVLRQEGSYYGDREAIKMVADSGEPWRFGIEEAELEAFLARYGLKLREHLGARELERMYFTGASGALVGRINGTHCLVRAASQNA
jgi:methyltransferase (TIGR00027 family)